MCGWLGRNLRCIVSLPDDEAGPGRPRSAVHLRPGLGSVVREATMAFIDPARLANEKAALRQPSGEYRGPQEPKRKPIRKFLRRLLGRPDK